MDRLSPTERKRLQHLHLLCTEMRTADLYRLRAQLAGPPVDDDDDVDDPDATDVLDDLCPH